MTIKDRFSNIFATVEGYIAMAAAAVVGFLTDHGFDLSSICVP